ncbi:MAG: alpha/beta fold hydrolase [Bacteroidota bacterium]
MHTYLRCILLLSSLSFAFTAYGQLSPQLHKIGTRDLNEIKQGIDQWGFRWVQKNRALDDLADSLLVYPVTFYRVEYPTTTGSQPIQASGLLLVPEAPGAHPMISYQHGTILPGTEHIAPSEYGNHRIRNPLNSNIEVALVASILASQGYVVSMPDYLGFGSTDSINQHYTYSPSLAQVSFDMLQASFTACQELEVPVSDQLFLAGYSEGAGATMALHRLLQAKGIPVTAQATLSGDYHYSYMVKTFAQSEDYFLAAPVYLWSAWTLNQQAPELGQPDDQIFRKPYNNLPLGFLLRSILPGYWARTSTNLLHPTLRQGLQEGTATEWQQAAERNDHHRWHAQAPVHLFHGADDPVLPAYHSEHAYEAMTQLGSEVTLFLYPTGGHFSLFDEYAVEAVRVFNGYRDSEPTPRAQ